jgi:SAM-dependent methyltransferase
MYYVSPEPQPEEITKLYKDAYSLCGLENGASNLKRRFKNMFSALRAREQMRRVGTLLPLNGILLLDVGAATGEVLEYAKKKGACALGIEPNARLHRHAQRHHRPVLNVGFEHFRDGRNFDLISFSHVLEHMPGIRETLKKVSTMVSKGGMLYIEVPFAPKPDEMERGKLHKYLNTPHLINFSGDSLTRLLEQHGFKTQVTERVLLGRSCILAKWFKTIDFNYEVSEGYGIRWLLSLFILCSVLIENRLGNDVWCSLGKNESWSGYGDVTWALFQKT